MVLFLASHQQGLAGCSEVHYVKFWYILCVHYQQVRLAYARESYP